MTELTIRDGVSGPGIVGARPGQNQGASAAPYHASAVHFDGSTWLRNGSLTAAANANDLSYVLWFKIPSIITIFPVLFIVDPEGAYATNVTYCPNPSQFGFPPDQIATVLSQGSTSRFTEISNRSPAPIGDGSWHSLVWSGNGATGVSKSYIDDVDVTGTYTPSSSGNVNFGGFSFWVGSDGFGDNVIGDIADFRVMVGTTLLTSGDIPEATRRLFVNASNKPVNPAVATGSLGPPTILLSGDATGFATNQGTGGAFTTTGALTNASTSPSD